MSEDRCRIIKTERAATCICYRVENARIAASPGFLCGRTRKYPYKAILPALKMAVRNNGSSRDTWGSGALRAARRIQQGSLLIAEGYPRTLWSMSA